MLLDTHVLVRLVSGQPLKAAGQEQIAAGLYEARLLVSAVTAWELSQLVRSRRVDLGGPARTWFGTALTRTRASTVDLSPDIALAAFELPDWDHRDPADRFLVATARLLGVPLLTRDREILAYAAAGHVEAIAC